MAFLLKEISTNCLYSLKIGSRVSKRFCCTSKSNLPSLALSLSLCDPLPMTEAMIPLKPSNKSLQKPSKNPQRPRTQTTHNTHKGLLIHIMLRLIEQISFSSQKSTSAAASSPEKKKDGKES